MNPLEKISNDLQDCLTNTCVQNKCKLVIGNIKNLSIIMDCDKYKNKNNIVEEICDFIIFTYKKLNIFVIGAIELKSGRVDIDKAIKQIKNCAIIADKKTFHIKNLKFIPILVYIKNLKLHGKTIKVNELRKLKKSKIQFRGKKFGIYPTKSDTNYRIILKKFGISI